MSARLLSLDVVLVDTIAMASVRISVSPTKVKTMARECIASSPSASCRQVMTKWGAQALPEAKLMEQLAEKWRPYRSVGSAYMWMVIDEKSNAKRSTAPVVSD